MKTYNVFISAKHGAWNKKANLIEILADNKTDALANAKQYVLNAGHDEKRDGPLVYSITETFYAPAFPPSK